MNHSLVQLLIRWTVLALGVTLATKLVPGIRCDDAPTLITVVLLLSFFNAVLKPLMLLFSLPFIVLTLGLGVLLINALLFYWVGHLVEGFHVASFWSAIGGAFIVSVTNLILNSLFRSPPRPPRTPPGGGATPPAQRGATRDGGGDVIDI